MPAVHLLAQSLPIYRVTTPFYITVYLPGNLHLHRARIADLNVHEFDASSRFVSNSAHVHTYLRLDRTPRFRALRLCRTLSPSLEAGFFSSSFSSRSGRFKRCKARLIQSAFSLLYQKKKRC